MTFLNKFFYISTTVSILYHYIYVKYTHGKGEFSGWDILFPCEIYILHLNLHRTHWKVTDFHSIKIGQLLDFYGIFKVFWGDFDIFCALMISPKYLDVKTSEEDITDSLSMQTSNEPFFLSYFGVSWTPVERFTSQKLCSIILSTRKLLRDVGMFPLCLPKPSPRQT